MNRETEMKDNHTPGICFRHHPSYYADNGELLRVPITENVDRIIASNIEPDNARLLSGGWNSYHKNCGDRAVECAEGDLLGECLGALKEARDTIFHLAQDIPGYYNDCGCTAYEDLDAVLTKARETP